MYIQSIQNLSGQPVSNHNQHIRVIIIRLKICDYKMNLHLINKAKWEREREREWMDLNVAVVDNKQMNWVIISSI